MISLIGFVESVSLAETLAAKRRQRIVPDQELIGLGAANIAHRVIRSLVDFRSVARVYKYSKSDFAAMAATILVTLGFGVEPDVVSGVLLSLILHLYRTSKPHMAVIGQIPDTEHFRNIERHDVLTDDSILSLWIDESLYFANRRFLENRIEELVAKNASIKHLVLVCPAVNLIDASAVESLEMINHRLNSLGIQLHLSEVKGPVMDRLQRKDFLKNFKGGVFLRHYEAVMTLQKKA